MIFGPVREHHMVTLNDRSVALGTEVKVPETAYGVAKRLRWVREIVEERRPSSVLDVGCGTGTLLTLPLARIFPETTFVGFETDTATLRAAAAQASPPNLSYVDEAGLDPDARYPLVIASEVLEHVDEPVAFLEMLRGKLAPGGVAVITVPNRYGPHELVTAAVGAFEPLGIWRGLRAVKRWVVPPAGAEILRRDTIAVSPHVNFFTSGLLQNLFRAAGLRPVRYLARSFLCGYGLDLIVRGRLRYWNTTIAERLPPALVSGWMFVLEPVDPKPAPPYRRSLDARVRRWMHARMARFVAS